MNMFRRATAKYEAKTKSQQPQGNLAKQPYPHSSQGPRHDANIKEQFQKPVGSSSPSNSSQSSKPAGFFQDRSSSRPMDNPQPIFRTVNGNSLASLYGKQDSFKEDSNLIDLTAEDHQVVNRPTSNVDIFEGDFSDDENLDLDYSTDSSRSTKRATPDNDTQTVQRPAKKRVLPSSYLPSTKGATSLGPTSVHNIATPAAKSQEQPKQSRPWDLTPDTIKNQQKNLKVKSKKPATSGADTSLEEMQQAVKSYTVKQSAISLSNEQEHVKELVCQRGKSVFFTGPAGTGKSVLMRAIVQELKKKHAKDPERLAVTASTGLAACNIGGMTLHSFSGIGLGKDDAQTLVKKIRRNPKAKNRWMRTKVLIIDEISMVDGDLFDKLSQIGRIIRNNGRPWGGIQLVITGDFFQLPPVPDRDSRETKFAFEAATWNTAIDHTIGLTEVFRQKDPVFASMLNEMRLGRISDQTVTAFKKLSRPLHFGDGLEVTELVEVENSNQRRLKDLPGEVHRYEALDSGDPVVREKLLGNMMAPKVLELKKGAQVMLIKNLDETLVNGSLGTVIGFSTESAFEISGGAFDDAHDNGDDIDPKVKKRLAAFSRQLSENASSDKKKYPLVQFHAVDGTARIMLCCSEPWKVETPTGEVQASREQLPLILAWALSIHKAQGQTLARVKVDLGKVFEKGQAYVALSRATTQEGLQVLRFDKQKVMAHPRVITFYQKLYSAEAAFKKKPDSSITNFAYKAASRQAARKFTGDDDVDDEEEAMASYA
ncbi:hypothetical protein VPNG_03363 [Cytospora leucostoma]|uniref:ATP-dependent DNA helicase PIF1 n=1 Tax=Cytospora leucostoma TaxID=1230097 RepID=A0A423XFI1_9PEZI|nr:hypothetical protein VPNG_03363 [Cytospora leucostoma]